jgi:hypothetical protein
MFWNFHRMSFDERASASRPIANISICLRTRAFEESGVKFEVFSKILLKQNIRESCSVKENAPLLPSSLPIALSPSGTGE